MEDIKIISWEELRDAEQNNISFFSEGVAITIGSFDGCHIGHTELFNSVFNFAKKNNYKAGLVTFIMPTALSKNKHYPGDVSTTRLRLRKFNQLGFDFIILIDFSTDFAKIEGSVFFDILIKTIHLKYLAVGEDFACGYRRGLGVKELKKLAPQKDFCIDSIKTVTINNDLKISSTAIRNAVNIADFTLAKKLLGYPFLFDIIGPPWQIEKNTLIASRKFITQIIPNCGKYKVFVNDILGNKTKAIFFIDNDDVRLEFNSVSSEYIRENLNNFDTIEFINKE